MFCPRCGNQISEGLKFCKTCGLPVAQISTYVATGGTAPLSPSMMPAPIEEPEYLTPKQQMILTIALCIFAIPVLAVLSELLGLPGELTALAAILMPLAMIWSVIHYKAQMRRREYLRQQQQQQEPAPRQIPQMPTPVYQSSLPPPPTNPLANTGRGSIIEDETRKLPEKK